MSSQLPIVQIRRGTKTQWETVGIDIVPLEGEIVLEQSETAPRLKVGDGQHTYSELPYFTSDAEATEALWQTLVGRPQLGKGEGEGAILGNDVATNKALGTNAVAFGEGTVAGCRGFNILAIEPAGYDSAEMAPTEMHLTLDSVEGLAVDDSCSVAINKNYMEMGKITNISENTITINAYPDDLTAAIISTTVVGGGEKLAYVFVSTKQDIGTTIFGSAQHAEGYGTAALMVASHAEGAATIASGKYSHAEGDSTFAGYVAHAEGQRTSALGGVSHAEGSNTTASGVSSHAEGQLSTASGSHSHAEGYQTTAEGNRAHSEGYKTSATGTDSHSEGSSSRATGEQSHAEGQGTVASAWVAHAEGYNTTASKNKSHAEGGGTTASGETAHAEGHFTIASGYASHAEGYSSNPDEGLVITASAKGSHAEGVDTLASAEGSHAEGENSKAIGDSSHAEGSHTTASESCSHAEGYNTKASSVFSHAEGSGTEASGSASHAEGHTTIASGVAAHAEGATTESSGNNSHSEGVSSKATGESSHAEGAGSNANGQASHAEGDHASAIGASSHAEGSYSYSYGPMSHAEGRGTKAGIKDNVTAGEGAHAEGRYTTASGQAAHAEGNSTVASGAHSHAEGTNSKATVARAHAEGFATIATADSQHVQGKYNVQNSNMAHIVGGGTSDAARKNIHTLDWSGNAWFAGDVSVGTNADKLAKESAVTALNQAVQVLQSQVVSLKAASYSYVVDSDTAYVKNIPENAMPFAFVNSVQGRTQPQISQEAVSMEFALDEPYQIKNTSGKTMFTVVSAAGNKGFILNSNSNTAPLSALKYYRCHLGSGYHGDNYLSAKLSTYSFSDNTYIPDANGTYAKDILSGEYFNTAETTFYCGNPHDTINYQPNVAIGNYVYDQQSALYRRVSLELCTEDGKIFDTHLWREFFPEWNTDSTEQERIAQYGKYRQSAKDDKYYQALRDQAGEYVTLDFCKKTLDSDYFIGAGDLALLYELDLGYGTSGLLINDQLAQLQDNWQNFECFAQEDDGALILVTTQQINRNITTAADGTKMITYYYGISSVHSDIMPSYVDIPVKAGFNMGISASTTLTANCKKTCSYNDVFGQSSPYISASFLTESGTSYNIWDYLDWVPDEFDATFTAASSIYDELAFLKVVYIAWGALATYSMAKCIFKDFAVEIELVGQHKRFSYEPIKPTRISVGTKTQDIDNLLPFPAAASNSITTGAPEPLGITWDAETRTYTLNGAFGKNSTQRLALLSASIRVPLPSEAATLKLVQTGGTVRWQGDDKLYIGLMNSWSVSIDYARIELHNNSSVGSQYSEVCRYPQYILELEHYPEISGIWLHSLPVTEPVQGDSACIYFDNFTFTFEFGQIEQRITPSGGIQIPSQVQQLEGYGVGRSQTVRNFLNLDAKLFVRTCRLTQQGTVEPLDKLEFVDVSQYFPHNILNIQNCDAIVLENQRNEPVNSVITYQVKH